MTSLFHEEAADRSGPVECLGVTFENGEARRAYFLERLREKLKDPGFRQIEGFPVGSDEDILELSDPPYYTACPNPFVGEFVQYCGKAYDSESDDYGRKPFAADVSEGKNDPIYNAHSYHTKVPHKAIMRYILHYTEPDDIVFDGFCGTGMTGVAAQLCGDLKAVEALRYKTREDGTILDEEGQAISRIGARRAVLNDLSPAATFIAYNYNTLVDVEEFEHEANRILEEVEAECGWMYLTLHQPDEERMREALDALREAPSDLAERMDLQFGRINYTVWSDVFVCPECSGEIVFWEAAVDKDAGKVRDKFACPTCSALLAKKGLGRAWETRYDEALGEQVRQARQVPVMINYSVGKKRFEKYPDDFDWAMISAIEESPVPYWFPTDRMPSGEESRRNDDIGLTHVHHFYTKRNLIMLSAFAHKAVVSRMPQRHLFTMTGALPELLKFARLRIGAYFHGGRGAVSAGVSGTLYIPSVNVEKRVLFGLENRTKTTIKVLADRTATTHSVVSSQSSSDLSTPSEQVDYIFTDPPFGGNLMYSELNFLWEAWLRVFTNNEPEAIENKLQGKGLLEYQDLMSQCFEEYHRVLKPGHWMTVEFHNSKNSVWNAIQESLQRAGFVVADVRTLDKKQGTFKQTTSAAAVKQDLVISAYKPNEELERRFGLEAGTEGGVWDFVESHLRQLPVVVEKDGAVEPVAERMGYLLFDRMVAFHVQRGVSVPLSAAEFYAGLKQRYPERDGMYFVPDHVAEYDRKRVKAHELLELQLFITGESSAIQWLRQELTRKPQTSQELSPEFMKDYGWAKHEKLLELGDLLKENFLRYRAGEPVPAQIVSWLKQSVHYRRKIAELEDRAGGIPVTGLETSDPQLISAAKDRWYVPDPNKAQDLEKLRESALLREFETYRAASVGRKLKVFRLEAVRVGFQKAWSERDYDTILDVARKVPENVLQEDPKLLMFYDNALDRTEEYE